MKINAIKWTQACCAWHGDYAEAPTVDGGTARIKRSPGVDGYLVMRFGPDNRPVEVDGEGVPVYAPMTSAEVEAVIS